MLQKDCLHTKIVLSPKKEFVQVEFSISGVKPAPKLLPDQTGNQSAVAMLPIGGQLAVAGENAVIQFYDAARDKHLEKLQVIFRYLIIM